MGAPIRNTPEKFWTFVDIKGPDECWLWKGSSFHKFGYGLFWYQGKSRCAHKLAYIFTNGDVPQGVCALHSCDNPPCCNPSHLHAGSLADNMHEMISRNRRHRKFGEAHHNAKLTNKDILYIKRLKAAGYTQTAIAKIFDVRQTTISRILRGERWGHLL